VTCCLFFIDQEVLQCLLLCCYLQLSGSQHVHVCGGIEGMCIHVCIMLRSMVFRVQVTPGATVAVTACGLVHI
jgi:hypothetical protein